MLAEISIRNLAIIEELRVTFARGFHVLTGETGAGKSIIIDALGLIAGGRGSSGLVRSGCEKAEIEALFDCKPEHPVWALLAELGIRHDASEYLLIRREITSSGKSAARVNGQLVNLSMLKDIGDLLVNIHGQHEHQSLLRVEKHLELLDAYGGEPVAAAKSAYAEAYARYRRAEEELKALSEGAQNALQMNDLYRFQADEIAAAALTEGEDDALEAERRKLANAEKLMDAVVRAYDALFGTGKALDLVSEASSRLEAISAYDPEKLKPLLEQVESAYYQLEDAAMQLRGYRDSMDFEPHRLDEVEDRLSRISALKRKYGATISDILKHYAFITGELAKTDNLDERLKRLEEELSLLRSRLEAEADRLTAARREAAARLSGEVEAQLRDLQMEKTRFAVWFEEGQERRFSPSGADRIEFRISANPGEPLQPLAKIASGGELSRIMLAIKTIFAALDDIPVLVFDEVDTGVSGRAAQAIAEKLANLSRHSQVFSVTHLPQVASMADAHYVIFKEIEGGRTYTRIHAVDGERRVEELARMLGGARVTETTLKHAREMIEMARK